MYLLLDCDLGVIRHPYVLRRRRKHSIWYSSKSRATILDTEQDVLSLIPSVLGIFGYRYIVTSIIVLAIFYKLEATYERQKATRRSQIRFEVLIATF